MSTAMADVPAPKQIKDFDMNDLKSQLDATSRKPVVGLKRTNSVERKQKVDIMVVGARHLPTMDPTVFDPRQSHALAAAAGPFRLSMEYGRGAKSGGISTIFLTTLPFLCADSISQAVGTCNAVYIHLKYGNKQVETTMRSYYLGITTRVNSDTISDADIACHTTRWDEKNPVWNEKFAFTLPLVDPSTV
eukprot:1818904-Rhodomonas_salina.2